MARRRLAAATSLPVPASRPSAPETPAALRHVAAESLPSADQLTTRIARCIGIWETNRGGDHPIPKESALDTVAGVHASMATIEQATMPYAIDALQKYEELRSKAAPPLTLPELDNAKDRCDAVVALLKAVSNASLEGMRPEDFIARNDAAIIATGLGNDDVMTMFRALTLKAAVDSLHAEVEAHRRTLDQAVAAVPEEHRLGLGAGSLKSYIRKPANWGENRAGWQRKAVDAMPGDVGARIEAVAESNDGTALATPVIRGRVDAQLRLTPRPSTEQLVTRVAEQNNPNEANYGNNVWANYARLYPN